MYRSLNFKVKILILLFFVFSCNDKEPNIKNNSSEKPLVKKNNDKQGGNEDSYSEIYELLSKKEINDKKFDFCKFKKIFSHGLKLIEKYKNDNIIIPFLGATGSGKSTTIAYLLGMPMKLVSKTGIKPSTLYSNDDAEDESDSDEDNLEYIIIDIEKIKDKKINIPKIGHFIKSETLYPKLYLQNYKQQINVLCDCPGFFDNRGHEEEAAVALCTRNLFISSKGIKALCFLITWNDLEASRSGIFRNISKILYKMFDTPEFYSESIFIIFTKPPYDNFNIKKYITKIIQIKNQYKISNNYDDKIQFKTAKMLLRHKKTNMFLINPVDEGESRKLILEKLQNSKVIPKDDFKFIGGENIKKELLDIFRTKINESTPLIKSKQESPKKIKKLINDIKLQKKIRTKNEKIIDDLNKEFNNKNYIKLMDFIEKFAFKNENLKYSNNQKNIKIQNLKNNISDKNSEISWKDTYSHQYVWNTRRNWVTWIQYDIYDYEKEIKNVESIVKDDITKSKNQLLNLKYDLKRYILSYMESYKRLPILSSDLKILYEANKYIGINDENINNFIKRYYLLYLKDMEFIDYSADLKNLEKIKIKPEDLNIFTYENDEKIKNYKESEEEKELE